MARAGIMVRLGTQIDTIKSVERAIFEAPTIFLRRSGSPNDLNSRTILSKRKTQTIKIENEMMICATTDRE